MELRIHGPATVEMITIKLSTCRDTLRQLGKGISSRDPPALLKALPSYIVTCIAEQTRSLG